MHTRARAHTGTGDVLVIHRPDGLATLEQWGTGAATSHTVTFMRTEATGALMVQNRLRHSLAGCASCEYPVSTVRVPCEYRE
jgi:hypothetical protein